MHSQRLTHFAHRFSQALPGSRSLVRRSSRRELLALPPSLRATDDGFLSEWRDGSFPLAGISVPIGAASPFAIAPTPPLWHRALLGFGWLRHIPTSADHALQARFQAVLADWHQGAARHTADATAIDIVARRVLSWLAHADLLLEATDARTYDTIMAALSGDGARIERQWRTLDAATGRITALIAMAQISLCLSHTADLLERAETALAAELGKLLAAQSHPELRNPPALVDLLLDLEPLRLLYGLRHLPAPAFLLQAISRLGACVAGLMLGNGTMARLARPRAETDARADLASVISHVGLPSTGAVYDAAAGYARLELGKTIVIIDVGAPYECRDALAIEMSSGTAPLFVSHGQAREASQTGTLRLLVRTTTAPPSIVRSQRDANLTPTHTVTIDLAGTTEQSIDATHAGHAPSGVVHRRRVALLDAGTRLSGIDEVRPLAGHDSTAIGPFAIRAVLHPSVTVAIGATLESVVMTLANGHRWQMSAPGPVMSLESALYRDGARLTPTLQVLLISTDPEPKPLAWSLTRLPDAS